MSVRVTCFIVCALTIVLGQPARAQSEAAAREPVHHRLVGQDEELANLLLLKSTAGAAVIRFGAGPLQQIAAGDRLGRNRATVKEIAPGRVVLEERFIDANGRPNVAFIVLANGEKGGRRYLRRPEEERPVNAKSKKPAGV